MSNKGRSDMWIKAGYERGAYWAQNSETRTLKGFPVELGDRHEESCKEALDARQKFIDEQNKK